MVQLMAMGLGSWGCSGGPRDNPSVVSSSGQPTSSGSTSSGSTSSGEGGSSSSGQGGNAAGPPSANLPSAVSDCPTLKDGTVSFDFLVDAEGAGGSGGSMLMQRNVEVRMSSEAKSKYGPFVIVWHSDGQDEKSALDQIMGSKTVDAILKQGGVVVAPAADPYAGSGAYLWWFTYGADDRIDDLVLMDQVLACAIEQTKIDTQHIHTIGYAEGAIQAAQAATRRSNYIASIVTHSVVYFDAPEQDPDNAYPVMILHGGAGDQDGFDFGSSSQTYASALMDSAETPFKVEHFTVICDHDLGHQIDLESLESAWEFLSDHPYGIDPSPYVKSNLPAGFPDYCEIQG